MVALKTKTVEIDMITSLKEFQKYLALITLSPNPTTGKILLGLPMGRKKRLAHHFL